MFIEAVDYSLRPAWAEVLLEAKGAVTLLPLYL
jgi:hypothetical protein